MVKWTVCNRQTQLRIKRLQSLNIHQPGSLGLWIREYSNHRRHWQTASGPLSLALSGSESEPFSTHGANSGTGPTHFPSPFDQAENHRADLGTARGAGKQEILSVDYKWLDVVLSPVVVQLQSTVPEIRQQIALYWVLLLIAHRLSISSEILSMSRSYLTSSLEALTIAKTHSLRSAPLSNILSARSM